MKAAARLATIAMMAALTMPLAAQADQATPDAATVAAGKKIYEGAGICATCHGLKGEGVLGPTLTLHAGKEKWLHHDGTWDGITKMIKEGIDGGDSKSGISMPAGGGANLSPEQIRQVAAYVLVLNRSKPKS